MSMEWGNHSAANNWLDRNKHVFISAEKVQLWSACPEDTSPFWGGIVDQDLVKCWCWGVNNQRQPLPGSP